MKYFLLGVLLAGMAQGQTGKDAPLGSHVLHWDTLPIVCIGVEANYCDYVYPSWGAWKVAAETDVKLPNQVGVYAGKNYPCTPDSFCLMTWGKPLVSIAEGAEKDKSYVGLPAAKLIWGDEPPFHTVSRGDGIQQDDVIHYDGDRIGSVGDPTFFRDYRTAPPMADGAETVKPDAGYVHDDQGCFKLVSGQQVPCPPSLGTPEPIDVPAIQKKRKACVDDDPPTYVCATIANSKCPCGTHYGDEDYWTCADEDRVLEESVNGKLHTCRRVEK